MKFEDLYTCEIFNVPSEAVENLKLLLPKLKRLEIKWGMPIQVNSGFRTRAQHKAIYQSINDKRLIVGLNPIPVILHSQHLLGNAADLNDPDGVLKTWVGANVPFLEDVGLWCEAFYATKNWLHVQQVPPQSGKRFFRPF